MKNNLNEQLIATLDKLENAEEIENDPRLLELLNKVSYNFDQYKKKIKTLENALRISNREIKIYRKQSDEAQLSSLHNSRLAAVGEMAANISHEINNPLAIIQGSVDVIETCVEPNSPVMKHLDTISKTVQRVSKIVTALKRISHDKNNFSESSKENLCDIVDGVISIISESLKKCQIRLELDYPQTESCTVIPQVEFSQVLANLLTNAKQAIENLPIEDKWIKISLVENESSFLMKIDNGGPAIPESIHQKIFDPFFTTKPVGKGTGIGLNISRKIMQQMKGDISLDKDKNYPSFVLTIPKVEQVPVPVVESTPKAS